LGYLGCGCVSSLAKTRRLKMELADVASVASIGLWFAILFLFLKQLGRDDIPPRNDVDEWER